MRALIIFLVALSLAGFVPVWAENIDINTATEEELMVIDRIGPTTSQRIVEYRNLHGPFSSYRELTKIPGLSSNFLKSIRSSLTTTDNLRCWNCGRIFGVSKYSNFGTCPHCHKKWPQQLRSTQEVTAEDADSETSLGELPIKVGDYRDRVIKIMGEDYREAPSTISGYDEIKQNLYRAGRLYYPADGLYLDFLQDRLWRIEVRKPFKWNIFGVYLGDVEGRVIELLGRPDRDGDPLYYDSHRGCIIYFKVDSTDKTVDRITVIDGLTQKKINRQRKIVR